MAFVEKVLPTDVSPGPTGGPMHRTTVKQLRGGGEYRNRLWAHPLRDFTVAYGARGEERLRDDLQTFALEVGGSHIGFRARDWSDYTAEDQLIGTGDGTTYYFRTTKRYGEYTRRITKPDATTVVIKADGVIVDPDTWFTDTENGVIVFQTPPVSGARITWSGEFHVPVRFTDDNIIFTMMTHKVGSVSSIGLKEVRVREDIDTDGYNDILEYLTAFDKTDLLDMLDVLHNHVNVKWGETA